MADGFKIGLAIRPKVGIIYQYMIENNLTLKALAELIGISYTHLGSIINFKVVPKRGHNSKALQKVFDFFGCSFEDIFPSQILKAISGTHSIFDTIPKNKLVSWTEKQFDLLPAPKEIDIDLIDLPTKIEEALCKLQPQEAEILRMRLGLGHCEREHTLNEIAKTFGVTQERIRQIEGRALRKLRNPEVNTKLKSIWNTL